MAIVWGGGIIGQIGPRALALTRTSSTAMKLSLHESISREPEPVQYPPPHTRMYPPPHMPSMKLSLESQSLCSVISYIVSHHHT
jgi:hypothetical protein